MRMVTAFQSGAGIYDNVPRFFVRFLLCCCVRQTFYPGRPAGVGSRIQNAELHVNRKGPKMRNVDLSPLDELDEGALYALLGDAWYAQIKTEVGKDYFLPCSSEVGRREFEVVLPILSEALRQPYFQGDIARVASTLKVEATWRMPAMVVVALARRRGMFATIPDC